MVTRGEIKKHFQLVPRTKSNIISFCQAEYENLARIRGDLYVTNYLTKLVEQVCSTLGLSNNFRNQILRGLYHVALSYRVRSGMESNKAPIFHPSKHLELIKYLWYKRSASVELAFANRTTAVHAILCFYSFRRWIDPTRIRWEHCRKTITQNRTFLKFNLSASKTNTKGQRNEYITLQQNDSEFCPIKILHQFWRIQGCPKTGFVLPCLHRHSKYLKNSLFQEWDAYVCSGHSKKGSDKIPCLGEVDGRTTFGYYKRAAKKLKWKTLPHRHSFRRAGIVIANKLSVPRERITEFFGWKNTSEMPSHYVQEELATTSQGLAWKFADALGNNLKCLEDVSFADC